MRAPSKNEKEKKVDEGPPRSHLMEAKMGRSRNVTKSAEGCDWLVGNACVPGRQSDIENKGCRWGRFPQRKNLLQQMEVWLALQQEQEQKNSKAGLTA